MIKINSKVRYIHEDTMEDKASGFYPPIGTCGTVTYVDAEGMCIQVQWDSGTDSDGIWFCEIDNVEEVTE